MFILVGKGVCEFSAFPFYFFSEKSDEKIWIYHIFCFFIYCTGLEQTERFVEKR